MSIASSSVRAFGSNAVVAVAESSALPAARAVLVRELRRLDLACSRFRDDSELVAVNRSAGTAVRVSSLLRVTVAAAVHAAEQTDGLVDPTVGRPLRLAGYDRSFVHLELRDGRLVRPEFTAGGRWREIEVDDELGTIRVPSGVELDLGATGKALAADRIAREAADVAKTGVLVSIGGDIAVAGLPPEGGWVIGIDDDHASRPCDVAARVSIAGGGVASSGTRVRRWLTSVGELHHIVDPRTGHPAKETWATVSVAGSSCVEANAASTAAVVLAEDAPTWLEERGFPARLARVDGRVRTVCGWPTEPLAA